MYIEKYSIVLAYMYMYMNSSKINMSLCCNEGFEYRSESVSILYFSVIGNSSKASTMPYARRSTPSIAGSGVFQGRTASQYGDVPESYHCKYCFNLYGLSEAQCSHCSYIPEVRWQCWLVFYLTK